ncbi:MAG: TIGR02281 family clan AA aspartic protease [Rhizobiaceae bacterium]|nr:TIGR02281 family clan AA aspartic protease [Rhizobiaceae bacterium]
MFSSSRAFWFVLAAIGAVLIVLVLNHEQGTTLGVDNDIVGHALYLGIWGSVIAAGILGSGMRLGHAARTLAVWLLIILALVAGYQYRYELQDVANRVTAGLVPGSPLSSTDAEGRATVTLEKMPDGHFGGRIRIDGHQIFAMVDTGATSTVLTFDDAIRAGFDAEALSYTIPVRTANGATQAARVMAAEVSIGAITRRDMPLLVASRGALDQTLLGMNFMGSLSGFDVRGDRMILRD